MVKTLLIQDSLSNAKSIDWDHIEGAIEYPETLLLTAYGLLKEKYEQEPPILNENFLREVHKSICDAFHIVYPQQFLQVVPTSADEFYHRGNERIHQSRYDEAFADFRKANEMEPNSHVFEFSLSQFWLRYGGDKRRALIWINKAILHLANESILVQVIYQHLKTTICSGLKRYDEAVKSLQICTSALSEMIERLEWKNGQASMEGGITIFAEGIRQSLCETIEASEHLLALVNGSLSSQVQAMLRVQKKLWKEL